MCGQQNDNSWPIKNSSTYEICLDIAIEACIGNCSPPPPKPKHRRVLHLTALSPPPPAEITKCPCDKIKALYIAIFWHTVPPTRINLCVHLCECVMIIKHLTRPCLVRLFWWPPCWEVGDCSPPPPLAHCELVRGALTRHRRFLVVASQSGFMPTQTTMPPTGIGGRNHAKMTTYHCTIFVVSNSLGHTLSIGTMIFAWQVLFNL